jgi:hypothetical protein
VLKRVDDDSVSAERITSAFLLAAANWEFPRFGVDPFAIATWRWPWMVSSRATGLLNKGRVCGDGAVEISPMLLALLSGGSKLGRAAKVARLDSFG